MVRTGRGPLRFIWAGAYALLIRLAVVSIRRASPEATVYCRGGFARDDVSYGLSDVDLVIAAPEAQENALKDRIARLYRRLPLTKDIVEISVSNRRQLSRSFGTPFPAWPVNGPSSLIEAAWVPTAGAKLAGPLRRWRLLAGEELPDSVERDPALRPLWSWLELQFIWKHMFRGCADPTQPHVSRNLVKSVTELTPVMHWAMHGEILPREAVLSGSPEVYPEEREILELTRWLRASLHRKPEAPLGPMVGFLSRSSARLAKWMKREAATAGGTWVQLVGEAPSSPLPLLDWRARTLPEAPEECFVITAGGIENPAVIGAVARAEKGSPYPALASGDLILLPTNRRGIVPHSPAAFRAVQCAATDPVSFALMARERRAKFPEFPGWAIEDAAARGVAEFRNWMESPGPMSAGRQLGVLFAAARAALLWESVAAGSPELAVTVDATASLMGGGAEEALECYHAWRTEGSEPPDKAVKRFRDLVLRLNAYDEGTACAAPVVPIRTAVRRRG